MLGLSGSGVYFLWLGMIWPGWSVALDLVLSVTVHISVPFEKTFCRQVRNFLIAI